MVVSLVCADTTLEMVLYYPWQPSVTIYYTIMAVSGHMMSCDHHMRSHDCHVTVMQYYQMHCFFFPPSLGQ